MADETGEANSEMRWTKIEAVRRETEDIRLSEAAKRAIRGYMLGILTIAGPIVAVIAGTAGYMFNDFAKAQATAVATTNALKDIQAPLIAGQVAVSEALRDAGDLQEKVAAIDGQVGQRLDSAEKRITRKVEELEADAAKARENVRDAGSELRNLQAQIEAIPNVTQLTESIESAAKGIGNDPVFQRLVVEKTLTGFTGMVAAFADECPADGWVPYEPAAGRMIVGVGALDDGQDEREFSFGDTDGRFQHTLKSEEMPNHAHGLSALHGRVPGQNESAFSAYLVPEHTRGDAYGSVNLPIQPSGEGKAHNNMPPYIALYFCKKGDG